jgi:hypothetical protein
MPRTFAMARYQSRFSFEEWKKATPGPGERDLRGRGHHPEPVRVPGRGGEADDVDDLRELVGESVHRVGVVPDDAEVGGRGLHRGEAFGDLAAHRVTAGVGEHRHRPHALDLRVLDEFADGLQVGAGLGHRDGEHLEAEGLGDGVVAVVAGDRADPLHGLPGAPRLRRVVVAEGHGPGDEVEHDVQAGGVRSHEQCGIDPQHTGPQVPDVGDAVGAAVVADVHAVAGAVVVGAGQGQQLVRQVQLFGGGLAAGQVEGQVPVLEFLVGRPDVGLVCQQVCGVFGGQLHGPGGPPRL